MAPAETLAVVVAVAAAAAGVHDSAEVYERSALDCFLHPIILVSCVVVVFEPVSSSQFSSRVAISSLNPHNRTQQLLNRFPIVTSILLEIRQLLLPSLVWSPFSLFLFHSQITSEKM